MAGCFACPECGSEVALEGYAPGRQVRCPDCSTLVEVPFFPRERKRPPHGVRQRSVIICTLVFCAVLVAGIAITSAGRALRTKGLAERDRAVAAFVASADSAERSARFDLAFEHLDAAIQRATKDKESPYSALPELRARRDALAVRDVKQRIESISQRPPTEALAQCRALLARLDADPAVELLRPELLEVLEQARMNAAIADLAEARNAWEQRNALRAVAACERVLGALTRTTSDHAARVIADADEIAVDIAGRLGVVQLPVRGKFLLGSGAAYDQILGTLVADGLQKRGYVNQPRLPALRAVWEKHAPYRVTIEVHEQEEGHYLQSVYPLIRIDSRLELTRTGSSTWQLPLTARTRSPIPGLAAYEAGHLATSQRRGTDGYKRMYDDSQAVLRELFPTKLRNLPAPLPTAAF